MLHVSDWPTQDPREQAVIHRWDVWLADGSQKLVWALHWYGALVRSLERGLEVERITLAEPL